MHLRLGTGLTGVAEVTVFGGPGDIAIVAGATELTIDNFQHVDLVAAGLKLEAQVRMTDLATESNTVKPMGKDSRPHTRLIRVVINYDITVFCLRYRGPEQPTKNKAQGQQILAHCRQPAKLVEHHYSL